MEDKDWEGILDSIKLGKCTPFLGAGVNYGLLPLGSEIAREWADKYKYPLNTSSDLASVAQFMAVDKSNPFYPKDRFLERLAGVKPADFTQKDDERLDCLRMLAELPLPIYLTTNFDHLMLKALQHTNPRKKPRQDICRWHAGLKKHPAVLGPKYAPDFANPLVFHLHGSDDKVESLVLTEDDYLDFLVNISRNQKLLPPRIQEALTTTSLLFIGYRLKDINFRVIYRGLVQSMEGSQRRLSLTVQMNPPDDHAGNPVAAAKFLTSYFGELKVRVYWGTAREFARDLRKRWEKFNANGANGNHGGPHE